MLCIKVHILLIFFQKEIEIHTYIHIYKHNYIFLYKKNIKEKSPV